MIRIVFEELPRGQGVNQVGESVFLLAHAYFELK
jgi:hypothetical protein